MFRQIKQTEHRQNKNMKKKSYHQRTKYQIHKNISLEIQSYTLKQIQQYLMLESIDQDIDKQTIKSINSRLNQLCIEIQNSINHEIIKKLNKIWNHPENPIRDLKKLNNYCYDKFQFMHETIQKQIYIRKVWRGHRRYSHPITKEIKSIKIKYNGEELNVELNPNILRRFRLTYQKPIKQQLLEYINYLCSTNQLYMVGVNQEISK